MDGIFVGHHERTGASLFLSERGLLRGTRVQRKTADQQWDNEFIRRCRGVPWMLIGEELEVRPPPMPAVMMPIPEAIVRTPLQWRRYILKQDVARYGPTPECEALYNSGRRSAESDEATFRRMQGRCGSDCTQTDSEEARQLSKQAKMSEDIQTLNWSDQACRREVAKKHLVTKAHESPREQERRLRGVVEKLSSLGQENPCKRRQKMPKRDEV